MLQVARRYGWIAWVLLAAGLVALAFIIGQPVNPQKMADRVRSDLTQIRELPFKRSVAVQEQSPEEFLKYLEAESQQMPSHPYQGEVLRTLGFIAADESLDLGAAAKQFVFDTEGYYDPHSGRIALVKKPSRKGLGILYSHELYHALQDQYFDLNAFLDERVRDGSLNHDELLARKALVEGEASYVSVLWELKRSRGSIPRDLPMERITDQDRELNAQNIIALHNDPRFRDALGGKRARAPKEPARPPSYLSHVQRDLYRYGLVFVHAVQRNGWSKVEELYRQSPPVSTEQILHPPKWFAGEYPVKIKWPAFATNRALADWELLADNVLGELQWRIMFRTHGFSSYLAATPAGGWNGDRYAVFKRRGGDDMLLLMYTCWDTERDAESFAKDYRLLQKEKYAQVSPPARIVEDGRRVVIVEGGDESSLDSFMKFAQSAEEIVDVER